VILSNPAGSLVVGRGQNAVVEPGAPPRFTTEQPALAAAAVSSPADATEVTGVEPAFEPGDGDLVEQVLSEQVLSELTADRRISAGVGIRGDEDPPLPGIRGTRESYRYLGPGGGFGSIHEVPQESLRTVNPEAMALVNDPEAAALAREYLDGAAASDPDFGAKVAAVLAKPATRVDTGGDEFVSWGRWVDGRQLRIDREGSTYVAVVREYDLPHQSGHGISLVPPDQPPPPVQARYDLFGGTSSTSLSGASRGSGAVDGDILVDFGTGQVNVSMTVRHGQDFTVTANPTLSDDFFFNVNRGRAVTASGICAGSGGCGVRMRGGFGGTAVDGVPPRAGLSYDIGATDAGGDRLTLPDPIQGVAAFRRAP
jgi:hypothetical protein